MKKSLFSVGSLLMVYLMLGSTAAAYFLPQAKLTGLEIKTATLGLLVGVRGGDNPTYVPSERLNGAVTLQPQMNPYVEQFWVKNNSSITQQVTVAAQLVGGEGDWEALGDLVEIEFVHMESGESSGWFTINQWREEQRPLPQPQLVETQAKKYQIHYEFADTYPTDPDGSGPISAGDPIGNEMMDKAITGVDIVLEATPTRL